MDESTRLIREGKAPKDLVQTVGPPIQKGSTVLLPNAAALYDYSRVSYGRMGLSSHIAFTEAMCALESAVSVELFPSGVGAMSAALLTVLQAGDEVLVTDSTYLPTRTFCDNVLKKFGVSTRYFASDARAADVLAMIGDRTRLIVMESPGSLSFEMLDVPAIVAGAKARGVLTAIDNTWGAGLTFKPCAIGVDLSVQSLTKYVGGHSDVFMGSIATADPKLGAALRAHSRMTGWAVSPEDAYQMLRGLRTLAVRMERQGAAGLEIAAWLAEQPQVLQVLHPALPGAPGHDLWRRDFTGAAGLFSVVLRPGGDVDALLDAVELFGLGYSWGGFESLVIPCDPQLKSRSHPRDYGGPLVRFHIGLESVADLKADLSVGLAAYG